MNLPRPRRVPLLAVCGLLCPLLLGPTEGLAQPVGGFHPGNARLLTTDAASVIEHPVLGLQRSAMPVAAGFAVDTSLYADLLLAPNVGLRWAKALGAQRMVVGARYTHFVGASVYSSIVEGQEPAVQRFEPTLSGPTLYGAYGVTVGPLLVQAEARFAYFETSYLSLTGAGALHLTGPWMLIAEVGARVEGGSAFRAAAGVRYGGEHFGLALGAAYVDLSDPVFANGGLAVSPVLDLSWTFQ